MLERIKLALRIVSDAFDDEIQLYIDDARLEMEMLGILVVDNDPQIVSTIIAYCKWKFGNNEDKSDWEKIYHEKLGQLKVSLGYRNG